MSFTADYLQTTECSSIEAINQIQLFLGQNILPPPLMISYGSKIKVLILQVTLTIIHYQLKLSLK